MFLEGGFLHASEFLLQQYYVLELIDYALCVQPRECKSPLRTIPIIYLQ